MTRSGPLARSYPGAVALVICALVPFLMLTTAVLPVSSMIAANIGMSPKRFDVVVAMSDAAYAVGSVLAVQLAQHFRQRRLLLMYAIAFAVASALSVWAPTAWIFAAAFIVQGLCTSLMLIAAVPPLVTGWTVGKLPVTVLVMNLCIFGAVSIGPTLGAVQADAHHWRPLFGVVAASSILAVGLVLLTFDDDDPADQEAPWDLFAVLGAAVGCAAAFFGAGYLEGYRVVAARSLVPLCVGTALIVLLVVHQYRT
ncbi:MAG TPA: MFS transporter, partial [Micromonosporaceae bacterium]